MRASIRGPISSLSGFSRDPIAAVKGRPGCIPLISTATLNDVDPRAWLADVIARIADRAVRRLDELLPWHWRGARDTMTVAARSFPTHRTADEHGLAA